MTKCQEQAIFRYTWPGRDECYACLTHANQLQGVANAMGFYLQLIPLGMEQLLNAYCSQNLKESL